jgi:hypothetical protein
MRKLLAPLTIALGFLGVVLLGFNVSAHAAETVDPSNSSPLDLLRPIFDEVMKGHYIAATALALVLAVALVKRYAPGKAGDFVHSDAGGSLTTMLMAMLGAIATATMGGAPWSWGILTTAAMVGVAAMGGYTAIKRLIIEPLLRPLAAKAPAWAQPLFGLVLWIFDRRFQGDAVKNAEAAGTAAVVAHPGEGANSVAGNPTEL